MTILLIIITIMALIGTPLFTIMGGLSVINFLKEGMLLVVPQEISGLSGMALLHSIPLFTFAGYILAESKASTRLVRLSRALLGWMPGGMAIVTLVTCALFTAFTGGSGVTIVAIGGFLLPALLAERYDENFSLGLVTTGGSLGLLFPPSLPIILFGVMAAVDIEQLFLSGIVPGIFLLLVLSLYGVWRSRKCSFVRVAFSWRELGAALWDIKWELPLPFLLVGGIYSGLITISDSAAFTVLYVLIAEVLLTKDIKFSDLPKIIKNSMVLVGSILIILAVSLASSNYIVYKEIPDQIFRAISGFITNKVMFLLALNIFLIIVGCIMDIFSALVVIVPLILPLADAYNVDLVHLGIIFLLNLEMGYITPPVGMNLFISSVRFDKPILKICKAVLPFIALSFMTLMLVTYIPFMSLWYVTPPALQGKWTASDDDGNNTELTLKAGGLSYYKSGDFFSFTFADPTVGTFSADKHILNVTTDGETKTYRYELFRRGESLKLTDEDGNSVMYKNVINPPLNAMAGKFTRRWESDGDTYFEFALNGRVNYKTDDIFGEGRYEVKNSKLHIYPDDNDEKIIWKFKFMENDDALLLSKGTSRISLHGVNPSDNN
ncbi:MAG: TRAP transporter large permease [Spirochaetales bacterium]|nr:TRAP transporter large permease [Spirochaetales bacterium]